MVELIFFGISGLVLLWAVLSFSHATAGGERAGHHHSTTFDRVEDEPGERRREKYSMYSAMNYVLGVLVFAATVGMVVAALVY